MTEGAPSPRPGKPGANGGDAGEPTLALSRELGDFAKTLLIALPPGIVAAWIIARDEVSPHARIGLLLSLILSAVLTWIHRSALSRRLRTLSSVLASYREGDFSIRARTVTGGAALHGVLAECNQLGDTLREHRLGEIEAWTLLRKVMSEVDVVVLAFNDDGRVRLANDAAARSLGKSAPSMLGETASTLGLSELLKGAAPRVVKEPAALGRGPWELRRGTFRLAGEPHTLVVLSDMGGALRENEREAWRRLIRVMGHEINNSLAPIRSISESLLAQLGAPSLPRDWAQDLAQGLEVIGRRSEALGRFMASYATLARLPPPRLAKVSVPALVRKIARLEQRATVEVMDGPDLHVAADADQLEQVLINLVKNGVEAALETQGKVRVRWTKAERFVEIEVEDDGPGVSDTANLFVPFFTTKPGGSGIGLVLSRQIVEAHDGQLLLSSRPGGGGAIAVVRLPLPTVV